MAEEGMEIKGAHEDAVDHMAESGDSLAQRVALVTAILSTLGAVFSYQSGHSQIEASFLKSSAVAKQTQASDQWAYYQAKSTREYLAHVTATQSPDLALRKQLLADEQRYAKEKDDAQRKAKQLEEEAARLDAKAEAVLKPHRRRHSP